MLERRVITYRTTYNRPFTTSHGTRTGTEVILLELHWKGLVGYGEASIPPYRKADPKNLVTLLETAPLPDPEEGLDAMLDQLETFFDGRSEGMAAFDIALHDLFAKKQQISVAEMLGISGATTAQNMYTIATDTLSEIEERVKEAPGTDIFKFKLTGANDRAMLAEMNKYRDRAMFIDANQGWSGIAHWKGLSDMLDLCDLQGIEQPFSTTDLESSTQLRSLTPVPIYADESFERLADISPVAKSFSGINLKLMKCGGIRNALKIIVPARKAGLKIMLGSMSETSCGTAAALQMAPLVDLLDQDGPWLLANDPFEIVSGPGLGIRKRY